MEQGRKRVLAGLLALGAAVLFGTACGAADVLLVGDLRLKPVAEVVAGIRQTLSASLKAYPPRDVQGRLEAVVAKEEARVVIALGREAIADALALPPGIPVVYGLTIEPPVGARANATGTFMATPVAEYVSVLRRYFPLLRRLSVVGSLSLLKTVGAEGGGQVAPFAAANSFELVRTIRQIDGADALLLLPDVAALTPTALEEIYLYSFRKNVPLLGISEKHVKQGALLALVFEPAAMGRQIGELTAQGLRGANLAQVPPSPARAFELFVNTETARKMGLPVPDELLKRARRVYP